MRRWLRALAVLPLALWGCNGDSTSGREVEVPGGVLASEQARQRGRGHYLRHCALCHGERADGVGVRRNLSSEPHDFTDPSWRRRVRPEDVYVVIRDGRRGTAMASWKVLGEEATWELVAYLLSVAESPD